MARKRYGRTVAKFFAGIVLAVLAYLGLQYGAVLNAMDQAAAQYSQGDIDGALQTYESVEARVRSHGALRVIPTRDRQNLFLNQARLLYALQRFDDAAERLEKEDEITGTTTDGRFYLLRGEIGFRKAIKNYQTSAKKDINLLEENLLGSEDSLRESLRLGPGDWDAKYNYEFINYVRNLMNQNDDGKIKILMENVRVKETQPKPLPPDKQS